MAIVLSTKSAAAQGPSSREEDDLLLRSSKKIKNFDSNSSFEEWPKLGGNGWKAGPSGPSFAEMLQGINKTTGENGEAELEDAMSDDSLSDNIQNDSDKEDSAPLCVITEDPDRNFPTFSFSDKMKKRLYKAWNKAVIVKLLGRNIGYKLLLSIIQKLWAKKGVLSLINIGMGYFVVKFTNKEDYLNSLTGGPWMIFDHYLTVRPWTPQFNPSVLRLTRLRWEECKSGPSERRVETLSKEGAVLENKGDMEVEGAIHVTGGCLSTEKDSWKVVNKHRRQKKGGKEKPSGGAGESSRSADGGSRFGVLAVENSVEAVGDTPSQSLAFRAPRWLPDGESRGKVKGQQSLKSEKRTRDAEGATGESNVSQRQNVERISGDIGSDGDKRVLSAQEVSEGMHRETLNSAMVPFESNRMILVKWGSWMGSMVGFGLAQMTWTQLMRSFFSQIRTISKSSRPSVLVLSETKTEKENSFRCLAKLGYDCLTFVPSLGRSGGLLVAWKKDLISISMLGKDRQFIHLHCSVNGMQSFALTAIYAVPNDSLKQVLWQRLEGIAASTFIPWVAVGDFNDILNSGERIGGAEVSYSRIQKFQDRIAACNLSDMGSCGPKFTWRGIA
ncbi:hypothetical protein K1719_025553 [Acacia pycnantha]|nr:hypothetical protein K1719_025553 [Acacia pycnantha]